MQSRNRVETNDGMLKKVFLPGILKIMTDFAVYQDQFPSKRGGYHILKICNTHILYVIAHYQHTISLLNTSLK